MVHVICTPELQCRLFGWPTMVKLSVAERKAIVKIHLGGMSALRCNGIAVACSTVNSMVRKGLLCKDGPTAYGAYIAEYLAEEEFDSLTVSPNGAAQGFPVP